MRMSLSLNAMLVLASITTFGKENETDPSTETASHNTRETPEEITGGVPIDSISPGGSTGSGEIIGKHTEQWTTDEMLDDVAWSSAAMERSTATVTGTEAHTSSLQSLETNSGHFATSTTPARQTETSKSLVHSTASTRPPISASPFAPTLPADVITTTAIGDLSSFSPTTSFTSTRSSLHTTITSTSINADLPSTIKESTSVIITTTSDTVSHMDKYPYGGYHIHRSRGKDSNRMLVICAVGLLLILLLLLIMAVLVTAILVTRSQKRKKREARRRQARKRPKMMSGADMSEMHFEHKGALVLQPKLKGPVRNVCEDTGALEHIQFDPSLNEVVDIGSNVEILNAGQTTTVTSAEAGETKSGRASAKTAKPLEVEGKIKK